MDVTKFSFRRQMKYLWKESPLSVHFATVGKKETKLCYFVSLTTREKRNEKVSKLHAKIVCYGSFITNAFQTLLNGAPFISI